MLSLTVNKILRSEGTVSKAPKICLSKGLLFILREFLCLVLVEPKTPCYRAHVCVLNSGFSRILSPTTWDHFRAMFVWFSYPEKTWRRWQLFATIAPCAHTARLFNDVGKFSMFKINFSYFHSRAKLNFRWIFPGGGLPYETDGDVRRKFWIQPLKETIWAWLKLFVTPKGDQSGRGLSKFWPLKETT